MHFAMQEKIRYTDAISMAKEKGEAMAFRLLDLGIPEYDTNVKALYTHAVTHGRSHLAADQEYVEDAVGKTDARVILHYYYEDDGETPREVEAHTFLNSASRWPSSALAAEGHEIMLDGACLPAEVINATLPTAWLMPMLWADQVTFAMEAAAFGLDGTQAKLGRAFLGDEGIRITARVADIRPQVTSGLWLFSAVEMELAGGGRLVMPVSRDEMEDQLAASDIGGFVQAQGKLSVRYLWPDEI